MENSHQHEEKRKGYLLLMIGIFIVGLAIAILLTIYNQNLLDEKGRNTIIEQETRE